MRACLSELGEAGSAALYSLSNQHFNVLCSIAENQGGDFGWVKGCSPFDCPFMQWHVGVDQELLAEFTG